MNNIVNFIEGKVMSDKNISDFFFCAGQQIAMKTPSGVDFDEGVVSEEEILAFSLESDDTPSVLKAKLKTTGSVDFKKDLGLSNGEQVYIRGSLFTSMGNVCCVARILPAKAIPLNQLNIDDSCLISLKKILRSKSGLVIFSGPTGSGKSTTISSALSWLAEKENKVILTVEDPVEFVFKSKNSVMVQKQVGVDCASFTDGIVDSLRQAPDVIFIGEVRRPEEFYAAITAAETGHLVITTMHTPQIEQIPGRIINTFEAEKGKEIRDKLSSVLKLLVTQRIIEEQGEVISYFEFLTVTPAIKSIISGQEDAQMSSYIEQENSQRINTVLKNKYDDGIIDANMAISLATDQMNIMSVIDFDGDKNE